MSEFRRWLSRQSDLPVVLDPGRVVLSPITERPTMTEAEWLVSTDPVAMLRVLTHEYTPAPGVGRPRQVQPTDRKLRLFACACCRQVWDATRCKACGGEGGGIYGLEEAEWECNTCRGTGTVRGLTDPRSRRAVEVAERYADGEATEDELLGALRSAEWNEDMSLRTGNGYGGQVCVRSASTAAQNMVLRPHNGMLTPATQAALLRCLCGNPWRPVVLAAGPVAAGSGAVCWTALLRWSGGTVPKMAQAIYDERAFDRLPILADALEEAGCVDEVCPNCKDADFGLTDLGSPMMGGQEPYASRAKKYWNRQCVCGGTRRIPHPLIAHCRGPGPHARGCHVLDCLLGKS